MSRLAKKPIVIPAKTEVSYSAGVVTVKGPLGTLSKPLRPNVKLTIEPGLVTLTAAHEAPETPILLGTYYSHIKNMIEGVNKPYEKKLIVEGIGFKADVKGKDLVMALGFSHQIVMPIPADLKVVSDKTGITVSGIDCEKVGQFAAEIRSKRSRSHTSAKG